MTGKLVPFSATLLALFGLAPGSWAQEREELAQLDPSWKDAPQSEDDQGEKPDAQASPAPSAAPAPNPASPLPPPAWPPPLPPPWAEYDQWFRVELSGNEPALRFRVYSLAKGADKKAPIHGCGNPCRVMLPRGEYRVQVAGRPDQVEGDRTIDVRADTRARFTLPDRGARAGGLALGITGSALVGAGMMVLIISSWGARCSGPCSLPESDDGTPVLSYVGFGMVITGAVLTPLGWIQFARNRRPDIEQRPLRSAAREAKAPRAAIGVAPLAGGAAAAFRASF
jgi:hypothetical protein